MLLSEDIPIFIYLISQLINQFIICFIYLVYLYYLVSLYYSVYCDFSLSVQRSFLVFRPSPFVLGASRGARSKGKEEWSSGFPKGCLVENTNKTPQNN